MSQLDNLPPDQRAVLSLLLRQGKTYGEVAAKLHIDEAAVRERAQAALASLGPRAISGLTPERREAVGDYLLGQQNGSELDATRRYLEGSAAGRGWARVVSGEVRPLSAGSLPDIPAEGAGAAAPAASVGRGADAAPPAATAGEPAGAGAANAEAANRGPGRLGAGRPSLPSSRVGGLLLLLGLGAAIALVVVLLVNGGGGGGKGSGTVTGKSSAATATTGTSTASAQVFAHAALAPVQRGSRSSAQLVVGAQPGNQPALVFRATNLPATRGFTYALWLINSSKDVAPIGLLPAVKSDGAAAAAEPVCPTSAASTTVACLPSNYKRFKLVILTREAGNRPTHPGAIVLGGSLVAG